MPSAQQQGRQAEELALAYFLQNGYELKARNVRYKRSEIDLIVSKDQLLVFVEVKFRKGIQYGHPEEFVSVNQQRSIIDGADFYIESNNWSGNIRFDIIAVDAQMNIEHFEDAFY